MLYLVAFKFFVIILASPGANYRYTPITIKLSNHSLGSLCHLLSQRKNKLWSFQKVHFIKQSYMLYTLPQSAKVIYILLLFLLKTHKYYLCIRKNQCRFLCFIKCTFWNILKWVILENSKRGVAMNLIKELYNYREMLFSLVRKSIKVLF